MSITGGKQVIATTTVNLRKGAGLDYAIVGQLAPNAAATVVGGPATYNGLTWWQLDGGKWAAESVAGKVLIVADDDLFGRCIAFVFESEGGHSTDRSDNGNWTGGKVGVGEFKGTKYGISAAAYKHIDIANLTRQQAELIYRADYWHASGADNQPWPLCLIVLDTAVLHGVGRAVAWLKSSGGDVWEYMALRIESYTTMDTWHYHGAGWVNRMVFIISATNRKSHYATRHNG